MTVQKYEEMLINFAEILKEKNSEMFFKNIEIDRLKKQLEQAEEIIKKMDGLVVIPMDENKSHVISKITEEKAAD